MSLSIGIVGLPNVGKSTLFTALTKKTGLAANYPFATIDPNVGIVDVPDSRLQKLADIVNPGRIVPATVEFVDIAGLVKGANEGEGLGNQFLANIRETDAICEVVRYFKDPNVMREVGRTGEFVDPAGDADTIMTELILADMGTLEKQLPKLEKEAKRDKELMPKFEVAKRLLAWLNEGKRAASMEMTDEERAAAKGLFLLTMKPILYVANVDEDMLNEDRYAELLAGVTEPEEKRRIIGTQFWKEFFAVAQQLETDGKPVKYLAQGTIYPDIIESGARKTGGKTATIKSHHNLIPFPDGVHFDLIEPLDHFFKDEVRALGLALGLPGHIVFRQPFPGPGLAIRIIGAVDKEKLEILKNADAIVREELDAYNQRLFEQTGERNSEHSCWQYFAVLPDIKSVGVMGDERTYQRPIILRAVESSDAMTADWAKLPYDVLARISGRIVAEVPGANRVCYDITSKPPATIEWE